MSVSFESSQDGNWFELIFDRGPGALLLADRDRRIRLVNRNLELLFGYSRTELIGRPLELLFPLRFRDRLPGYVADFFAAPKARAIGFGRDLFAIRKDGLEIQVEISLNPIETSAGLLTLASIVDISVRMRVEDLEQRMAALVESAEDAIVTKNLDGVVQSWNAGAEQLLGYRADEIIGLPVTLLLPQDRQDDESMILDRISCGQRVEHFETVRRRKDGTIVDVSLTISPIRDRAGAIVGVSKIMRDITQRKQEEEKLRRSNQELAQVNAELDEFVYTASHDLRSPLTGVGTVVQWILEDDNSLASKSRERLILVQGRIERMKRLLNDIREYARLGRFTETSGEHLSAASLVADIAATIDIPPGFSLASDSSLEAIEVERVPLEQVLHNLINNALKHHDRNDGSVAISVSSDESRLRFFVVDDGPGIPEMSREDIFGMFKTLKPRDQVEGSGIGLALVRKIVGRMGGKCGIEPVGDRGSRFWFDWPRARGAT